MLAGHASGCWRSALGAGMPYNREKKTKVTNICFSIGDFFLNLNFLGVPAAYFLFAGTIPAAYFLFAGTVPAAYSLFAGTIPEYNLFHKLKLYTTSEPRCIF